MVLSRGQQSWLRLLGRCHHRQLHLGSSTCLSPTRSSACDIPILVCRLPIQEELFALWSGAEHRQGLSRSKFLQLTVNQ